MLIVAFAHVHAQTPATKALSASAPVEAHQAISVDSRAQLFAVMCALDAAGYESGASAAGESAGRMQLRKRMLALQGPAAAALRKFYAEHALGDSGATFSRFVSFALVAGPPPDFQFELRRDDLPPEALSLEGFNAILANFYSEAKLDELWKFYQPDYERGVESLRAPVSNLVYTVSNYLREIVRSNSPRTFSVYVEPLAGDRTIFRTFGDQYALVVRPSTNPPMDDIRHALLHFLLDPIAIRYRVQASKTSQLLEYAARAPQLPVDLRDDFPDFFDECLVRAVELRLRRLPPAELAAAIDQAEGSGYVLERPIYAGLSGFEKSEPAMGYYLPDLIKGIDVDAEQRRLRGVKFADAAPAAAAPPESFRAAAKPAASSNPLDDDLAEGQRQISARNGTAAAASFERVLASHPDDERATYGLAVASALQGKPDQARELFTKVIEAAQNPLAGTGAHTDPSNLSWSHIYLGRMYDVEGKRDLAVLEYRAALAVAGAPDSARNAAQRGVEAGYRTPSRDK
ncbi:MAG TPA: tetratricopeptide repeat protein [Candidatus Acidoferrales bacterium]|nr:tetratricopeptide repeat protein [Candidatus Acidoferrales bacterium]